MFTKQVLIIRKDLGMSCGKIASQTAHASVMALLSMSSKNANVIVMKQNKYLDNWYSSGYTKIVLAASSEEELLSLYAKASYRKLPCYLVLDEGRTELGKPEFTAVGIGPWEVSEIDAITSRLQLL